MNRTKKYKILISILILGVLSGIIFTNYNQRNSFNKEDDEVVVQQSEPTRAKLTNKTYTTETIDLSEGLRNITIEPENRVIWENSQASSVVIMVAEGDTPIFEKRIEGFSETGWTFFDSGEYQYYIDDVNSTGTIRVR